MSDAIQVYEEMKRFVGFDATDEANLKALAPVFAKHGKAITDGFYETLGKFPITAKIIDGQVDRLKATHGHWMSQLFGGDYGQDYFESRMRIGMVHVKINLPPYYVEGVMNYLRAKGLEAILSEVPNEAEASAKYTSLLKVLDLDLLIINLAYGEERLDRLVAITGMTRKLLENLVKHGGKKK
jgi:hypothetical protein